MKDLNWKILLIVLTIGAAVWLAYPLEKNIKLGLDLQGGMHLVLEVEAEVALENTIERYAMEIRRELEKHEVDYRSIKLNKDNDLNILLYDSEYVKNVKDILRDFPALKIDKNAKNDSSALMYTLDSREAERILINAVDQALETIRNRVDQFGVSEPTIQKQGNRNIIIQLPGIKDTKRAIELIGKTALLEFKLADEEHSIDDAIKGDMPDDLEILYKKIKDRDTGEEISKNPFLLKKKTLMTGDYITNADVKIDTQYNEPYVSITFDKIGTKVFAQITREHIKKRLAIVLDGNVYSAPVIQDEITGGQAQITGSFKLEEARDLAIVLRAGSLPAPVHILENRTVGPSLGHDSIYKGFISIAVGGALVLLFMPLYYRLSGIVANIALFLNLILLVGTLAYFNATLTLPGIAGIILTIGMAVDANVLIFERIREELHIGKSVKASVNTGFSKAFLTIVDANITTLIAAVVLFQFGTGPIKGFAITLSIGITASMFTACFVAKVIFDIALKRKNITKLSI